MRVRLDSRGRPRPPPQPPSPTAGSSSSSLSPTTDVHPSSSAESAPAPPPDKPDPPEPAPILVAPPPTPVPSPPPPQQHLHQTASPAPPAPSKAPAAKPTPPPSAEPSRPPPRPPLPQPSRSIALPAALPLSSAARPADDERGSDSGSSVAEAYNSEDEHMSSSGRTTAAVGDVPMRSLRERERIFASQLLSRGLRIVDMRADGNCLFRALAYAVWGDAEFHVPLRAKVIDYLVQERDYFSQFVAEDFARYVRRKSRDGTHGNHLELQAAAELFGKPIEVYSYGPTPATIIDSWGTPADGSARPPEPVRLSFHRGSHYNAVEPVGAAGEKRAQAKRDADLQWRAAVDARATQDEMERAVLALSLVEASRGESAAGSSASSSASTMPSTVLALIHSGYTEERAKEAYRVAGHGGLAEMVRFLTSDFFNPGSYAPVSTWQGSRGAGAGPVGSARPGQSGRCAQEPAGNGADRRPEASTAIRKGGPEAQAMHGEGSASAKPGNSKE